MSNETFQNLTVSINRGNIVEINKSSLQIGTWLVLEYIKSPGTLKYSNSFQFLIKFTILPNNKLKHRWWIKHTETHCLNVKNWTKGQTTSSGFGWHFRLLCMAKFLLSSLLGIIWNNCFFLYITGDYLLACHQFHSFFQELV